MTVEKYFHIVHNLLARHWAVAKKQMIYEAVSTGRGIVDGRIVLLDSSYIDVFEEIFIENDALMKGRYSYQYMKTSPVFRYDNYPRHPGISPPFHHKHITQDVIQLEAAPKLIDIIEEATRFMF